MLYLNDISMSSCYMKGTHAFHDTVYFPVRLSLEKCHYEKGKTATTFGWWRDPGYWLWEREQGSTQEKGSDKGLLRTRKSNQLVMIIVPERRAEKERGEKRNERWESEMNEEWQRGWGSIMQAWLLAFIILPIMQHMKGPWLPVCAPACMHFITSAQNSIFSLQTLFVKLLDLQLL